MYYQSLILKKIPGIYHGFGTKTDPVATPLLKIWNDEKPVWTQTHGVEIGEVTKPNQKLGDVDIIVTRSQHPIGVVTADCVPILFAKNDGSAVAAIHSGWKGTLAKAVDVFSQRLLIMGEEPKNWTAAVGPSIGPCCYQVSVELIDQFKKAFPYIAPTLLEPSERKLNLQAINAQELERCGFSKVDVLEHCTHCTIEKDSTIFHSYRRDGSGTRQWSLICRD